MKNLVILRYLHLLFSLSLLTSFPIATSRSRRDLRRGDSLSSTKQSDFITSPDNSFTCGFHGLGTNAYWFAIWFTDSRDKTVIWTANRDRPVNSKGSKAKFRRDGSMVLTDVDGSVVWQTNTTTTDVTKAELLNTGNLVLKNQRGEVLWQSFDSPTDTLLPSQTFTKNARLKSALGKEGYESGYFNLYFGSDNILRLISDSPDTSSIYWPNPDFSFYSYGRTNYNSSRIAVLDDMGQFLSSDQLQFNTSDMGYGVKRRLTMDYDGNLRVYSLNNSTRTWDITWQAIQQPCDVKGVCGKYAICVYTPEPKCTCPPEFKPSDPRNWNLGCKAKFDETALLNSRQVKFIEIAHTDYYGFDLNATSNITLQTCRETCLNDPRCQGFSYKITGRGDCFVKSALFNGYASPDFPGTIYIKVPVSTKTSKPNRVSASSLTCKPSQADIVVGSASMYNFNSKKVRWDYIYSFTGTLGVIEAVLVLTGWWFLFRKHGVPSSVEAGYRMISSQFRRYDYSQLKKATNNFKEELGSGGSGSVYRGILSNRLVAVKRLRDVHRAEEEFFAEIGTLGNINHMNLVRICGFCSEKKHKLLVYEYIDNLSLDRHIFGPEFLDWKQRYAVAIGTAKGLAYLHHECLEWVIHCDVKPENILLDGEFRPKIADFGLAKLTRREGPGSEFSRIRGTKGYMAPEWVLNHPITAKVDVFGFGVVILEMAKGARVCDWDEGDDEQGNGLMKFVRETKEKIEGRGGLDWVESVVDRRLEGNYSREQAAVLIGIGVSCVDEDRNKRPAMASVVQALLDCDEEEDKIVQL